MKTNLTTNGGNVNTTNKKSPSSREELSRFADKLLYHKIKDKEDAERDLIELLQSFNKNKLIVDSEQFIAAKGLLIEFACLLVDPEISSRIQEDWYKRNGGDILKRMIDFFHYMSEDHQIHYLLTYNNLKYFSGCGDETLDELKEWYELPD